MMQSLPAKENDQQADDYPLHLWHPQYCGEMPLKIDIDGQWWSAADFETPMTPIRRLKICQLFAKILCYETIESSMRYCLKTPAEKVSIQVEDVPFIIIDTSWVEEQGSKTLSCMTQTGTTFRINAAHPLEMLHPPHQPELKLPYACVRDNLKGRFSRGVFYRLIEEISAFDHAGVTIDQSLDCFVEQIRCAV